MKSARVSRNHGDLHASNGIAVARRLPTAGKIRPGVKVLTAAASKVDGLAAIYRAGLEQGRPFDLIAADMKKVKGCPNYPLTPKNAPYFSVRQCDFTADGAAQTIMDRYATVRPGDPVPRLYAFPVIFPSDSLDLIFREQFEAWKASELLRWSEVDPESGELMCMRRAVTAPDPQARRRWGGRPAEAERACDPNDCRLFEKGDCKHVGSLSFWIPGVPGVGAIELTFTSLYASMGVVETLDMVRAGLGRVSGLLPNGRPIFWISKQRERVARMNWETGKPEKSDQWIIALDASGLEMSQVLAGAPLLEASAPTAVAALTGPEPAPEPEQVATQPQPDPAVRELRQQLSALVNTLDWSPDDLGAWVAHNYADQAAAVRDAVQLADMVAKLTALAEQMPAATADDDEVPF